MRTDIKDRSDCERLVRDFYSKALNDHYIGWLFVDIAKIDLEKHIPRITSFWETVLLGSQTYRGGAFAPHVAIHTQAPLTAAHFGRWLLLWYESVDKLFEGERAELAKAHANRVAQAFHGRLQTFSNPASPIEDEVAS